MSDTNTSDVVILGAGLAGLTLAIQLKHAIPDLTVTIIERKSLPYPEATHKVGESTVEIAAHYFADTLGLRSHLDTEQLRKLGIRLFFSSDNNATIEKRVELGSSRYFHVPTYQIDRGRFENFLIEQVRELGVHLISESKVSNLSVVNSEGVAAPHPQFLPANYLASETSERHIISFDNPHGPSSLSAKWLVDASGRAGLLKRKLQLQEESPHDSNAVWFRVPHKINIDDWSVDPNWCEGHDGIYSRWFSTNHLTGHGYWVWLIPLSSHYTSIGIVTDPKIHPLTNFRSFTSTCAWLEEFEPKLAEVLRTIDEEPADFLAIKHYAHGCSRVLSPDRWAITGDAGVFLDPLYSPGSDFIAIQNTFITDTIVRDLRDQRFIGRAEVYNQLYLQLSQSVLKSFHQQYPLFGNPRVMPLKVIWDYTIYWGFLAFLVIQGRICDITSLKSLEDAVGEIYALNEAMQKRLLAQHLTDSTPVSPGFVDISRIPFLLEFNERLTMNLPHDNLFIDELRHNISTIKRAHQAIIDVMAGGDDGWQTPEALCEILAQFPASGPSPLSFESELTAST